MSMIRALRNYLCTCPLFSGQKPEVDCLSAVPLAYAIERVAAKEVLRRYRDGGKLKQFVFDLVSREWIGRSTEDAISAAERYESFAAWLEEQTAAENLPQLPSGKTAQSIAVVIAPHMADHTGDSAKYRIRCRLVYFEGGNETWQTRA